MAAKQIYVLGLETSCDETAAAIVEAPMADGQLQGPGRIVGQRILSQIETHAPYGGVVPELAARAHISHLDRLIAETLADAEMRLADMDAIAATAGPGLIGGVLIGLTTGKALALAVNKPFIGINHLEGHALSARLVEQVAFPYLLLLVSGGHCQVLEVAGLGRYRVLGSTLDDAVGEAFDKAAKLMSLGYPGGPEIERRARDGNPQAYPLPRPLTQEPGCDFSFSGLKTALRQAAEKAAPLTPAAINDLAASFQAAVTDCLVNRTAHGMRMFAARHAAPAGQKPSLVVAGGVAANQHIGAALRRAAADYGFQVIAPPPALCTDNAAMIARAGAERLAAYGGDITGAADKVTGGLADGLAGGLAVPARARWPLAELAAPLPAK